MLDDDVDMDDMADIDMDDIDMDEKFGHLTSPLNHQQFKEIVFNKGRV